MLEMKSGHYEVMPSLFGQRHTGPEIRPLHQLAAIELGGVAVVIVMVEEYSTSVEP